MKSNSFPHPNRNKLVLVYSAKESIHFPSPLDIRGHRPIYSLGGKFLANREGDCESCFREEEENNKAGYGKGMGRKFSVPNFLRKIRG